MTHPHYHWIIDNGHGGMIDGVYQTAGKRYIHPGGPAIYEGVVNRILAADLYSNLLFSNFEGQLLVPEPDDISLDERVERVEKIVKKHPNAIVVSIHLNAGKGTGWEVYTTPGQTKSDSLATIFFREFEKMFPEMAMRADYSDRDPDKEARFKILQKTSCPAILTENFFMDTLKPDAMLIDSLFGRNRIILAHFNAICKIEKTIPV